MYIRGISYYAPEQKVSSTEVGSWTGADPEFIETKVGVTTRAYAQPSMGATGMAEQALYKLFDEFSLDKDDVDFLIVVTQNPDQRLPHTAALLQGSLSLPRSCGSFDLALGCSGYVYALTTISSLMASLGLNNGIIVTSDPYSKIMRKDDEATVAVFGDAATATWISSQASSGTSLRIGEGVFGTDGSGAKYLNTTVKDNVVLERVFDFEESTVDDSLGNELYMNGRAIYNFALKNVPSAVQDSVDKNQERIEDIDHFVFHQASFFLIDNLTRHMDLPSEKVVLEMQDLGNTVSSTIPIALRRLIDNEGDLNGKKIIVCGFGVGLSWGANVLYG